MSVCALVTHAPDPVTAELARYVAEVLADRWIEAELAPFKLVAALRGYDCVVLGTPLERRSPPPDLAAFLARHGELLRELPAALFWHRRPDEPAAPHGAAPLLAVRAQLEPVSVGDFAMAGEGDSPGAWRQARAGRRSSRGRSTASVIPNLQDPR